nr:L,D-transpeptidase [Bacillus sp. M6-12]
MHLLLSLAMLSPIWPFDLDRNPAPGDPFIIVNKASNQLAYIDDNKLQFVVPAGTGISDDLTPEGLFTVKVKAVNPYYRKKDITGGELRNPLGTRWIGFDAKGTDGRIYGIHGTNQPWTVGKYVSQGCIRLKKEDVERLYPLVPIGTKILIASTSKSFLQLGKENGTIR